MSLASIGGAIVTRLIPVEPSAEGASSKTTAERLDGLPSKGKVLALIVRTEAKLRLEKRTALK